MIAPGPGQVIKDGKILRCGYTTGSCATGAAKAAAMVLEGEYPEWVEIGTPAGKRLRLPVEIHKSYKEYAVCSVKKDAGDDPDATNGLDIFARVSKRCDGEIAITGGPGVGRITRKGIFGKVGDYAINPVPREMIEKELKELDPFGYHVVIFVPEGEDVAKKTFNKNIGIEGGISIIGTTGIVQPMSERALLDTIYLEMDQTLKEYGQDRLLLVMGNHGEKMADKLGLVLPTIKISNFIGESIQYAYNKGFKSVILMGHVGKLSKLSLGVFNTHNRVCDSRIEAFVYHLALMGAPRDYLKIISQCITGEEAMLMCLRDGYGKVARMMEKASEERIRNYLKDEDFDIKVVIYSMERGVEIC